MIVDASMTDIPRPQRWRKEYEVVEDRREDESHGTTNARFVEKLCPCVDTKFFAESHFSKICNYW